MSWRPNISFRVFILLCVVLVYGAIDSRPAWTQDSLETSSSCPSFDLNQSPESAFRRIPIYDQGSTGICYAAAAATLLNHYRISAGLEPDADPVAMAWNLARYEAREPGRFLDIDDDSLASGQVALTLALAQRVGICPAAHVDAMAGLLLGDSEAKPMDLLNIIEGVGRLARHEAPWWETHDSRRDLISRSIRQLSLSGSISVHPNAQSVDRIASIYDAVSGSSEAILPVLGRILNGCGTRMITAGSPSPHSASVNGEEELRRALLYHLQRARPVELTLCWRGRGELNHGFGVVTEACYGSHAVVITGSRPSESGACEFLVRNSWGEDWREADHQCACVLTDGSYLPNCPIGTAGISEVVGCWYGASELGPRASGVTWLP